MYKELSLTTFKEEMAYRGEVLIYFLGTFIQLAIMYFLWSAVFKAYGAETLKGFTLPMMITYVSISTVLGIYNRSAVEWWIEEDVRTGFLSLILTKPLNFPGYYFFRDLGRMAFLFLVRCLPLLLIAFFFLNIALPSSPIFFVSAVLGFFINFFLLFITGLWSFWSSGSIWGMRFTRIIVSDMLSGSLIPIFLFPYWLRQISYVLPFQAVYSTPLLIYTGQISGSDALVSLGVQLFWIAALGVAAFLIWKRAEKKTISQGG